MKTLSSLLTIIPVVIAVSGCSPSAPGPVTDRGEASTSTTTKNGQSTIVSQMENYYKENSELPLDPCRDNFIHYMESIGYALTANIVLPEGREKYGYWFASCNYNSDSISALTETSTAPIMSNDESMSPSNSTYKRSYFIDIDGRKTIVRPPADGYGSCMLSMTASFGSVTITGRPRIKTDSTDPCGKMVQLLRQIEPLIDD